MRGALQRRSRLFAIARHLLRDERAEAVSDRALMLGVLALGSLVVLLALGNQLRPLLTGAEPVRPH